MKKKGFLRPFLSFSLDVTSEFPKNPHTDSCYAQPAHNHIIIDVEHLTMFY